jgi:hypothetical protein
MKVRLFAGVAAVGLFWAASGAFAADIEQLNVQAVNTGVITNNGSINVGQSIRGGDGATATVAAQGAAASISVESINAGRNDCVCSTKVYSSTVAATNGANVTNNGSIVAGHGISGGAGAAVTVAAIGASASVSVVSINGSSHGKY